MMLVPVTGVLATVHKLADRDPEAAGVLVQFALFDALEHQIREHRDELDNYGNELIAKQTARARAALLKRSVGKAMRGDDTQDETEVAQGLAILDAYVEKSLSESLRQAFNRKVHRDAGGRFASVGGGDENAELGSRQSSRHAEIMEHIDRWKKSGLLDDNGTVSVQMGRVDPVTGRQTSDRGPVLAIPVTGAKEELHGHLAADSTLIPTGVGLRRNSIPGGLGPQRRAALDAMQMFAGPQGTGDNALALASGIPQKEQLRNSDAAGRWNKASVGSDRKSYRQMAMTGRALASTTVAGTGANTVGQLASLIGDLGPEAEDVLGPSIRRTAYRYRGTERRPGRAMVGQMGEANAYLEQLNSGSPQKAAVTRRGIEQQVTPNRPGGARVIAPPAAGVSAYYSGPAGHRLSEDGLDLRTRGDVAAIVMRDQVPNMETARLSMEAGELPPSRGVMINAKGDVVSEAQGFNGDHYLPFDLKNLRGLQGGQYVRTRAIGGLTTEDLYTGLLSGARQMQVISNSGVFTVELDPSIRGGRRYTDKATRMIGRYGKLLEAVDEGKIYLHDIDPAEQRKIRADALEQAGYDEKLGTLIGDNNLRIARLKNAAIGDDEIEAQVRREQPSGSRPADIADAVKEAVNQQRSTGVRTTKLDGDGYAAAMESLRQEFPFFIRSASYETLPDFMAARYQVPREKRTGAKDRGHVKPNETNPDLPGAPTTVPRSRAAAVERTDEESTPGSIATAAAAAVGTNGIETAPTIETVTTSRSFHRAVVGSGATLGPVAVSWASQQDQLPAEDATDDTMPPMWLAHKYLSGEPRDLATWLATKATPRQAERFVKGTNSLVTWGNGFEPDVQQFNAGGESWDEVERAAGNVEELVQAMHPYASKDEAPDPVMVEFDSARPAAFPEITALGIDLKAFDRFLKTPANQPIAQWVTTLDGGDGQDDLESALDMIENGKVPAVVDQAKTKAKAIQMARSFIAGRDAAETMRRLVGGPDPKALPASLVGKRSRPPLPPVDQRFAAIAKRLLQG